MLGTSIPQRNIELFFQDEQLKELHNMIEMEEEGCEAKFKQVFEQLQSGKLSINYVVPKSVIFDPPPYVANRLKVSYLSEIRRSDNHILHI